MKVSSKSWQWAIVGLFLGGAAAFAIYSSQFDSLPQVSYGLFPAAATPTSTSRVLIVSPHEDDESLGAAGYIQQTISVGGKVEIIFATDGNKHGKKAVREAEARAVDGNLGVTQNEIKFFDFPDSNLASHEQAFSNQLSHEIADFHPTVVVTTLPDDDHQDHATCGRVVLKLWRQGKSFQPLFFLVHYDRFPRPIGSKPNRYLLPPLELLNTSYQWQTLPLSSTEESVKLQAIEGYRSQLSVANPILRQLLFSFVRKNELFALPRESF